MSIAVKVIYRRRGGKFRPQEQGHIAILDTRDWRDIKNVEIMGFFYNPIHCCYNDADVTQKTFRNMDHVQCEALRRYLAGEY